MPAERYRILQTLGSGGMGTVYLAVLVGEGGFEKRVALKKLRPELMRDTDSVELFMREARLAAQLNHPNIVQVFDGGLDHGDLYLALEYVDGGDLESVLNACRKRGRPPSPAAVALIGAHICEALCCLFELRDESGARLVEAHRDVSPGNVLISRAGVAKLSDFGVVRLRQSKTAFGKVRGKWEYFPPEIIHGKHDQRGDIYALGVTLYKLAALQHPFVAPTPQQHLERAFREEAAPLRHLPGALWAIIARALAKDPQQRYQTVEEMALDLDAYLCSSNERISPRSLARQLFAPVPEGSGEGPPVFDAQSGATEYAADVQEAIDVDVDLDDEPESTQVATHDELSRFEAIFGKRDGLTPSGPSIPVAPPEPAERRLGTGPVSEGELRASFAEFSTRRSANGEGGPAVTFEQFAVTVQNRRNQLQAKYPGCDVALGVGMQDGRVVVKLRALPR